MANLWIVAILAGILVTILRRQYRFRRYWYRNVYMHSPAWKLTRQLRKRDKCEKCKADYPLHLHHVNYRGYIWWNLLLPDLVSKMKTLCAYHHEMAHKTKKG